MPSSKLFNLDIERQLLGSMLLNNGCIDSVELLVRPEYFYSGENASIFKAVTEIYVRNNSCDALMLYDRIPNASYLSSLTDGIVSASNVDWCANQLKNLYLAREARRVFTEAAASVSSENVMEVINRTDDFAVSMSGKASVSQQDTMQTLLVDVVNELDERLKKGNQSTYLGPSTGFAQLDELMDGLPLGELTILSARPSIGKTAMSTALLTGIAKNGTPASIFSLEMTSRSLIKRILASETRTKPYFIQHGLVLSTQGGLNKLNATVNRLFEYNINYYDSTKIDGYIDSIIARIRLDAKNGVKVFFIDHLGLVKSRNSGMKRYEQVHDIMSRLHTLCQTLGVAIVVLCQLKRESEGRVPGLADLRESGDIEQDADNILFLHRERAKGNELEIPTDLILAKRREGSCGTVKFVYQPQIVRFEEAPSTEKKY